jgi:hypothetical protein
MLPLPEKQSDMWFQVAYYASLGFILPAAVMDLQSLVSRLSQETNN